MNFNRCMVTELGERQFLAERVLHLTFGIAGNERFSVTPLSYYMSDSTRRGSMKQKDSMLLETSIRPSSSHTCSILPGSSAEGQPHTQGQRNSVPEPDPDVERS